MHVQCISVYSATDHASALALLPVQSWKPPLAPRTLQTHSNPNRYTHVEGNIYIRIIRVQN